MAESEPLEQVEFGSYVTVELIDEQGHGEIISFLEGDVIE